MLRRRRIARRRTHEKRGKCRPRKQSTHRHPLIIDRHGPERQENRLVEKTCNGARLEPRGAHDKAHRAPANAAPSQAHDKERNAMTDATVNALPVSPSRAPVLVFLALAFPLSWYPWILSLVLHKGSGGPNPLGLLLAALIAASVAGGWRGASGLLRGIVRIGRSPAAIVVALLLPAASIAIALLIATTQGIAVTLHAPDWSDMLDRLIFTFLFVGLGEEPAWRGFLVPTLQQRLHPLAASVMVAVIWGVWHLPLMGTEFAWPLVPAFLASLFGATFVLSWIYNASGGSILLTMFTHATLNTIGAGYAFKLIAAPDLSHFWSIYAAVWLFAGFATIVLTKGRLGIHPLNPSATR
jgi:membrane protease YdiL (CAAX protease family)